MKMLMDSCHRAFAQTVSRYLCTILTATAPCPTADATRLITP